MEQIGRYKILGEIGRGAMGIVYRAQDPAIGRIVAIKTIRLGELSDPSDRLKLRDRLLREAQSAGILSHPGIVTIYDVAEQDDMAYIAMEFVNGPTLDAMMTTDPPDGTLILSILSQTAAALDYAHKRGIVHRDIKPANIMVHEQTVAKITDFGVARIQSHQATQAGQMVGTPNYMSPEQIQGQPVDGRSDQFSLAVIAYELLTGEKPFRADSIAALAFRIIQDEPAPVHRLNPTLEWPVDTVIKRALAKQPADRYPTCSEFAAAIENACRSSRVWKPIAPGASQNLPTLVTDAAPVVPAVAAEPEHLERAAPLVGQSVLEPDPEAPEKRTPAALRWARNAALLLVIGGIAAAFWLGTPQMFNSDDEIADASPQVTDVTEGSTTENQDRGRPNPTDITPTPPRQARTVVEEEVRTPESRRVTEQAKSQAGGSVRLVTNPPGATLVLDGKPELTCVAPCSLELSSGRHTVAATLDGYRQALKIFQAPQDGDVFLNLDRTTGTVMIRSEPRGASIYVDGQLRKEKTPALLRLPTGKHSIEVVQDDRRETRDLTIAESVITNLAVNF